MCRPSCCKHSLQGRRRRRWSLPVIPAAAFVAAKIGPTVAEIGRLVLEVCVVAGRDCAGLVLAATICAQPRGLLGAPSTSAVPQPVHGRFMAPHTGRIRAGQRAIVPGTAVTRASACGLSVPASRVSAGPACQPEPSGRGDRRCRSDLARNHRNNPYVMDRAMSGAPQHRRRALAVPHRRHSPSPRRWLVPGKWAVALTAVWTVIILAADHRLIAVLPWTRRFVIRRAWCVISRHRIQRVCFETRMHTRSGRLPLVLRITPTEVGERALIWCRAGICFEDFEAHAGEIAAACYARQARIEGSRGGRSSSRVDIVRRDTLARAPRHLVRPAPRPNPGRQSPAACPGTRGTPSSITGRQACLERECWHASQRRIHVLGPRDALAPRRAILSDYPGSWAEARKLAGLDWDPSPPRSTPLAGSDRRRRQPCTTSRSRAGSGSPGPTPAPSCPSTRTPTPSSTTAKWARSSKRSSPSPTSSGRPRACSTRAGRSGAWHCSTSPSSCRVTTAPTLPYLAMTNRHDGTGACALRATAVRIVCANTFRAAELEGERTGTTFSFIHKSNWRSRIEEARQAVTGAAAEMRGYRELATELLGIAITPRQRELFVTEFIPMPPEGLVTDRVARNVEEARKALRLIFESKTTEQVRTRPTAWSRPPASTSTTCARPAAGRPGSTAP